MDYTQNSKEERTLYKQRPLLLLVVFTIIFCNL